VIPQALPGIGSAIPQEITAWAGPGGSSRRSRTPGPGGAIRVLFFEEISYIPSLFDLWDCNLPEPQERPPGIPAVDRRLIRLAPRFPPAMMAVWPAFRPRGDR
jgi:hypothetical protein